MRYVALLVWLTLMAPWREALAQTPDTATLSPIVITATRVPVARDAVTAAVTVLHGADLRAQGIRTVGAAIRAAAGIAVVETGGFGGQTSLFLRGGESDFVKVLLDGVPLNQPGGAIDLADLTIDNVERIEIVRGPASVLYGSDAMAGVIQIVTRDGRGEGPARVAAAARAGTYGTLEMSGEAGGTVGVLGYALAVSRLASDGLYSYNSDYRNTVVTGRVRASADPRTALSLSYRYGDDVYHFPTDGTGAPRDSNQYSAERGPTLGVTVDRALGGGVAVQIVGHLRESRQTFSDQPDSPGQGGAFESRDWVRRASAGALLTWTPPAAAVTLGVEYEDARQRGRSAFDGFANPPVDVWRGTTAAFAQALLGLPGPLTAQLGLRLDANSEFGNHLTYRGGVRYRLPSGTSVRAALGTGFKEPSFFENFATGFVRGNPELDPERSTSWELGVDHVFGPAGLEVALTYFDQRFRDLIDFTFPPPPGDSVNYFNVAGASSRGVEATASLRLGGGVTAALGYTWLDTEGREPGFDPSGDGTFAEGRRLLRRPTHSLSQQIGAALGDRGHARVTLRVVGARDDLDFTRPAGDRRITLDPYAALDVAAEFEVWRRQHGAALSVTLRVDDATNARGREVANFRPRGRVVLVGGRARLAW